MNFPLDSYNRHAERVPAICRAATAAEHKRMAADDGFAGTAMLIWLMQ